MSQVLVTGGSGFVGSHCVLQLLMKGYQVRTTVRRPEREAEVRAMMRKAGIEAGPHLEFIVADLGSDANWRAAAEGCDFVLHVASPFPSTAPKDENELIAPARDGALRVLRAARDAGVKRVVMTSSFAAIGYGHAPSDEAFTETDWTNLDGADVTAYVKSKTVAERAAWEFVHRDGEGLELAVINPVGILGPVLGGDLSSSVVIVDRLLKGMPGCPRIYFGIVDVRDVADLHLRAMRDPAAAGERFLAVAGEPMSMLDVARALRAALGPSAARVPNRQLPDWVVRLLALGNPALKNVVPQLGKRRRASGEKARQVLGWSPRTNEEAVVAAGRSLLQANRSGAQ